MKNERDPGVTIMITCLLGIIISIGVIIFSCDSLSEDGCGSSNDSSYGECPICDGVGLVPNEGWGYSTCPYCHGTGTD